MTEDILGCDYTTFTWTVWVDQKVRAGEFEILSNGRIRFECDQKTGPLGVEDFRRSVELFMALYLPTSEVDLVSVGTDYELLPSGGRVIRSIEDSMISIRPTGTIDLGDAQADGYGVHSYDGFLGNVHSLLRDLTSANHNDVRLRLSPLCYALMHEGAVCGFYDHDRPGLGAQVIKRLQTVQMILAHAENKVLETRRAQCSGEVSEAEVTSPS